MGYYQEANSSLWFDCLMFSLHIRKPSERFRSSSEEFVLRSGDFGRLRRVFGMCWRLRLISYHFTGINFIYGFITGTSTLLCMSCDVYILTLGRISKLISPPWCKGGGGLMEPSLPPLGFRYVTIFRKVFTFSKKPMMSSRRWGASYVLKCGCHLGRHLGFHQNWDFDRKRKNWKKILLNIPNVTQ